MLQSRPWQASLSSHRPRTDSDSDDDDTSYAHRRPLQPPPKPRIQVQAASDSPLASTRPLSNHTASFSDRDTATSSPNTVDTALGPDTPPTSSSVLASAAASTRTPHIHNHRESKWARPSSSGSGSASGSISHGITAHTGPKRDRIAPPHTSTLPLHRDEWSFTGIVDRERMHRRASILPPLEQGLGLDTFDSTSDSHALRAPHAAPSLSERRRSSRDSLSAPLRRLSFNALPRRLSDGCTTNDSAGSPASSHISDRSSAAARRSAKHSWSIASLRGAAAERSESDSQVSTLASHGRRDLSPSPTLQRVHRSSSWTAASASSEADEQRKAFGHALDGHSTQLYTIPPTPGEPPSCAAATWIDPAAPSYMPAGLVRGRGSQEQSSRTAPKRLSLPAPLAIRRASHDDTAVPPTAAAPHQEAPKAIVSLKKGIQSFSLNMRFKAFNAKRRLRSQLTS